MRNILLSLIIALFFAGVWYATTTPAGYEYVVNTIDRILSTESDYRAAVFFTPSITVSDLKDKYFVAGENYRDEKGKKKEGDKVRVLIVPGHEPNYGGAEYKTLKEREMVAELSAYLLEFLKLNDKYEVFVTRDSNNWNSELKSYFDSSWDEIVAFTGTQKSEMIRLINSGEIKTYTSGVEHNNAPANVALRLYGVNKWANENDMDIVIHLHFNDYPRRSHSKPGVYSGFVIYVPESQYSNSEATRVVAEAINKRLSKYYPTSSLPKEGNGQGISETQELIAIGSYNSVDAASMLVEYGYIYEPIFANDMVRKFTLSDMAFQTYLGLQDFFGEGNNVTLRFDNFVLPHKFVNEIREGDGPNQDTLALQTALIVDGVYPPRGSTKNDCPRTGRVGPCTLKSIAEFQNRYGVTGEYNYVGPKTIMKLNELYSAQII
jgi:N-acetylmuramoyl-L-alanine amidase